MNTTELVDALRTRGLIGADVPVPEDDAERPWFLSILMGVAGWIAGIFVLVFLGILLDLNGLRQMLVIGLVLLGVAWGLYFIGRGRVFVDQLALALSIAGQMAIAAYFFDTLKEALPVAAAI